MLEKEGIKAGVWIQAFGFGEPIAEYDLPFTEKYRKITDMNSHECGDAFCPLDPDFSDFIADGIKRAASAGAEIIMLDDDLCLNIRPGLWLLCKQNDDTLAIALCNFSSDEQINPIIELKEKYKTADFIGIKGKLTEQNIQLETLPAYRFGTVILKKRFFTESCGIL